MVRLPVADGFSAADSGGAADVDYVLDLGGGEVSGVGFGGPKLDGVLAGEPHMPEFARMKGGGFLRAACSRHQILRFIS